MPHPLPEPSGASERAAAERAVAKIREDWGFHKSWSFQDLLRDWEATVRNVADGYALTFEGYARDLAIRDEIERCVGQLPTGLADRVKSWLARLDAQFMGCTRGVPEPLLPSDPGEQPREWWFRLPTSINPVDADVAATWSR
jgi:hypothetical protein